MKKLFTLVIALFYIVAGAIIVIMSSHISVQDELIVLLETRTFELVVLPDDPPCDILWYNYQQEVIGWAQITPTGFAIHDGKSYRIFTIDMKRLLDESPR